MARLRASGGDPVDTPPVELPGWVFGSTVDEFEAMYWPLAEKVNAYTATGDEIVVWKSARRRAFWLWGRFRTKDPR